MPGIGFTRRALGALFALALSSAVQGAVIYDQEVLQIGSFGFLSNTGSDETADDFTLGSAFEVTDFRWYGSYFPDVSTTDTFEISVYDDTSFASQIFSVSTTAASRADSGFVDDFGETIFEYNYTLASAFTLTSGDYLLSISNDNDVFSDWYWADSLQGDGTVFFNGVVDWVADSAAGVDVAFTIFGNPAQVPLPSTALLFLGSLLSLVLAKRLRA